MPRYFTRYWKNSTWKQYQKAGFEGKPLNYIAGDLFNKRHVSVGDLVYVVTVIEGELYLCGKLVVGKICDVNEAAAVLGRKPEDLWKANEHIVASSATPMHFHLKVDLELTKRLQFKTTEGIQTPKIKPSGHLVEQTLRTVRELDSASATQLDKFLPPLKKLFSSDGEIFPEEIVDTQTYYEGATKKITVNIYERDANARQACIDIHGVDCFVCGFNFQSVYGPVGNGFIHVHHLKPLSEIRAGYELDPVEDLRPVCPNCHAMIHKKIPAYTIEEMKNLLAL
jgi:5-methylcytosine-specific restriction protein A